MLVKILYNSFMACIAAILALNLSYAYGLTVINVDLTSAKQEIEGFGGSGAFYENWLYYHPQKQEIYDTIFGGLGTSIYRIRNSFGIDSQENMLRQADAIQAGEISLGHPLKIMISSWTPPKSLKSNGQRAGGTLSRQDPFGPKDSTNPYKYDEFAEWWAASLIAYNQLGITVSYISIQNEPNLVAGYDSCKFTDIETEDWAGYDSALDAVFQELTAMAEPPEILGPETTGATNAGYYIDDISNLTQVYGYAHHLYADGQGANHAERFDNPDSLIPAMQSFRVNFADKPIFQTEYCRLHNSDGFREAINLAKHMHNSLVEEEVAAYMTWGLFWAKDAGGDGEGLVLIDPDAPYPGYTINDTYYAFMHYSKYIQPGYKRINILDANVSGLRASAFKSPNEDTIVLVIINPEEESKEVSVSGLDTYDLCRVFRTDSSPNNKFTNITNNWDGNLSDQSITTVIYKSSCDVPPLINPISDESTVEGTAYTGPTPSLSQGTLPVTWSLDSYPSGMTIDSSTGVVSWSNPTTAGSPHTIIVRTSSSAGSDDENWRLTVNQNVTPPIINIVSDATTIEGTAYTGPTPSLSQGTLPVTWSLDSYPSGMTIDSSTGVVSWSNPTTAGSHHTIIIRASNAAGSDDENWRLTVNQNSPDGSDDTDIDGVSNSQDNCPNIYNPLQEDKDGDGIGDACANKALVEDFITRFYQLCLDRNPDQIGLDGWVAALLNGTQTGGDVAYGFVLSQEYRNKNTTDEEYLSVLYEAFFNRQPDSAGLQGWLDAMQNGASREDVLNGFIYANEFAALCEEYGIKAFEGRTIKTPREIVRAFVTRLYNICLDRDPDTPGLEVWTDNLINQMQTGTDAANGFIYSQEFINKNFTNEEYLAILYKAFAVRYPDQAGWDAWIAELNGGKDRGYVLNSFIGSQEFITLCESYGIKPY